MKFINPISNLNTVRELYLCPSLVKTILNNSCLQSSLKSHPLWVTLGFLTLKFGRILIILCSFAITYPLIWMCEFKDNFEKYMRNVQLRYKGGNLEIEHENISDVR